MINLWESFINNTSRNLIYIVMYKIQNLANYKDYQLIRRYDKWDSYFYSKHEPGTLRNYETESVWTAPLPICSETKVTHESHDSFGLGYFCDHTRLLFQDRHRYIRCNHISWIVHWIGTLNISNFTALKLMKLKIC